MVRLEKHGDSAVRFIFTDSDHYLYKDGVVDVPVNSLSLVIDESEMVTFKKASTADPFISFRLDKSNFSSRDELLTFYKENMVGAGGISEEEVQEMIDAATSGIPSSEVIEELRTDLNAVIDEVDTKQDILTAGENITISGNVISADAGNNIIELTQAEYDALTEKDPEALYIITDAQEINMNDYYTKSEVDASIATKADTSALTAVQDSLSGYVTTTTYESGQYATAQALNALQENKLDASAYTPTDLSEYWTSGQTQEAINAATSGIPSSQVVEQLRTDVNNLQGETNDIWDTIDLKEEVIASALTQLNQDVSDIDAKEEVIASALTEVNQALNNKLDASAYTPTDLSEYWTSGQTQTAINAATSGKADTSAVTAVNGALTTHTADTTVHVSQAEKATWNAKADASAITSIESSITAVSNDLQTLSGAVIDNEYTVSQAINELKSTKLDASAYTPTDLSQYWTSAQTQTAINAKQDALTAGSGISISNNVISTSGVVMSQQVTQIVKLTQAAYSALATKDNQTLYIVVD